MLPSPRHDPQVVIPARGSASLARSFWPTLTLSLLAASAITSYLAPCGFWTNYVFSVPFWHQSDPGGFYFGAAVHFFGPDRYPPVIGGHPGLTLQLLLHGILRLLHLSRSAHGETIAFEAFVAKNIHTLFFISQVAMTALHILSLYVLYRLSRKLLLDERACLLAVLLYATSLPTLYYLSRISPEPLLVVFFLWTVMSVWNFQENEVAQEKDKAYLWVASAGMCAAAAFYTKIHLAGPLIPFTLLQILLQRHRQDETVVHGLRARAWPALLFLGSAGVGMFLGSLKLNWPVFLRFLYDYMPGNNPLNSTYDRSLSLAENYLKGTGRGAGYLVNRLPMFLKLYTMPSSYEGLFALAEGLFFVCAIAGFVLYRRKQPQRRSRVVWLFLYWLMMLPVLIHRANFHYYFILMALGSVFCGYLLWELVQYLSPVRAKMFRPFRLCVLAVLLMHSVAIACYVNSRSHDVLTYRRDWLIYHRALDQLRYGERIAIVSPSQNDVPPLWFLHGIYPQYIGPETPIQRAFEQLFFVQVSSRAPGEETIARQRIGVVLFLGPTGPSIRRVGTQ